MAIEIPLKFLRQLNGQSPWEDFFHLTCRNECISGGYGSGKTTVACQKILFLLLTFPKYRVAIVRRTAKDLRQTTMKTFFKLCQPELYAEPHGRRSDTLGEVTLINGSEIIFMHLSDKENVEGVIRGLEINSIFIDQAEEIDENAYLHLDSRIARWDGADIPDYLHPETYPRNPVTSKPLVPAYTIISCNPDTELHWIYRRYHPESYEFKKRYNKTHRMITVSSEDNPALPSENLDEMLSRDEAFVRRFVRGEWGIPEGAIHKIHDSSILTCDDQHYGHLYNINPQLLEQILLRGALFRIMDHGDAAPTCCLWISAFKDWHFVYREYYKPGCLISEHRRNIANLSVYPFDGRPEGYVCNYADPAIFKRNAQKHGGFWSVSDEYKDSDIKEQPITWQPADNNEPFTRSRLSELLKLSSDVIHPISGESPAPKIYFIQKTDNYEYGCEFALSETRSQKRKQITTINGRPIFSDERDDKIEDHSYDCLRYYAGIRPGSPHEMVRIAQPGSFAYARKTMLAKRVRAQDWEQSTPNVSYV